MARKHQPKRTAKSNIYELEMSNGSKHYLARFSHNGTRYSDKNLTKLFGSKTVNSAFNKLEEIKYLLSEGVDVFSSKSDKMDELIYDYLDTTSDSYKKANTFFYNKHIKPVIGHLLISKVTKEHFLKIKKNMESLGLATSTIKKVRTVLFPTFEEAYNNEIIPRNTMKSVQMGVHGTKPKLTDLIEEPLAVAIRKIYHTALNEEYDYNIFFLISIMCARRFGEIAELAYEDIRDGVVHVRASTTKTYKDLHADMVVETYPLPKEVLNLIQTGTGRLFQHWHRTYMDKYATMMKDKVKLELRPLAKKFPIRSHSNRNFLQSLLSKKYGIDYVGAACLSHREEKSNINARYMSMEYEDRLELYETYWAILRENEFKTLTQNAITEQATELKSAYKLKL